MWAWGYPPYEHNGEYPSKRITGVRHGPLWHVREYFRLLRGY
jgi:hypothetical protein